MDCTAIQIKKVYERDMDLLIMEEFLESPTFAKLFLDEVGLEGAYTVVYAAHSLSDADGESDITLVLQYADRRVALLIEDKINAPTMPKQSARYAKRAEQAKRRGEYQQSFVILAAPEAYHKAHSADANAAYDFRVTYEKLRNWFAAQNTARGAFKMALIDRALEEKRLGYQVQEVEAVTCFWRDLRRYCEEQYPQLSMIGVDAPKGGGAAWPEFRTVQEKVRVIYKSQKGTVDLEFPEFGDRRGELRAILGKQLSEDMRLVKTGKAAAVRMEDPRWAISFHQDFTQQEAVILEVLQAVEKLCNLVEDVERWELY